MEHGGRCQIHQERRIQEEKTRKEEEERRVVEEKKRREEEACRRGLLWENHWAMGPSKWLV